MVTGFFRSYANAKKVYSIVVVQNTDTAVTENTDTAAVVKESEIHSE